MSLGDLDRLRNRYLAIRARYGLYALDEDGGEHIPPLMESDRVASDIPGRDHGVESREVRLCDWTDAIDEYLDKGDE